MLNIDYFNILTHIENLFSNNIYSRDKNINKDGEITITFTKLDNIEYKYRIEIYNNNSIKVTIPIKNSNYNYTTYIDDIVNLYNFICLHVTNIKSKQ